MIAKIELKKNIANTNILSIIIGKFNHWEKPNPIILLIINKRSEISLYYTILPIGLTISLRVKYSREPLLDSKEVA